MTLSYYLMHPEKAITNIMLYIGYRGQNKRISTKISIETKYWNAVSKRVNPIKKNGDHYHYNISLDSIENTLKSYESNCRLNNTPCTLNDLIKAFNDVVGNVEVSSNTLLLNYIDKFIENRKSLTSYSIGAIQSYNTLRKNLRDYFQKRSPTFQELDKNFFTAWSKYLFSKNFKPNHVHKNFANLKLVINEAENEGIKINQDVKNKSLFTKLGIVRQNDITKVYLSMAELKLLGTIK